MKQALIFSILLGMLYLTLSSNKTGPAHSGTGDRTGRLGTTCIDGCHKDYGTGPIGITTCTITLRRKDLGAGSPAVTRYITGKTYIVTISGNNTIALPKYGFQLTAVRGGNSVGAFGNFPANTGQVTIPSGTFVEHTTPLSGAAGSYSTSFEWTAPATGSGNITFWGILNAVDGNNAYNNDKPSNSVSLVLPDISAVSVQNAGIENKISIYPNPFTNILHINAKDIDRGYCTLKVFDLYGKIIAEQTPGISLGIDDLVLSTESWTAGYYLIQVTKDGHSACVPAFKR